jgi:hypothetical protein
METARKQCSRCDDLFFVLSRHHHRNIAMVYQVLAQQRKIRKLLDTIAGLESTLVSTQARASKMEIVEQSEKALEE